ncbi:hypothetical protein RND81_07G096500 [Saponaria officinalis]|uniref:F-box domain-containing protein n=1 Tax=Saponaria officinalis TaxID=3572 RepID=A0AAW1JNK1_SAPOF
MVADWSSLPTDLLSDIATKLETIEDFIYFSVVCRSWNHASSSIKHSWKGARVPWLLLAENKNENPNFIRKVFSLNNNKCYKLNLPEIFGARCWGSPYGWVAMVGRDLSVELFNPITKVKFHFPSCKTLSHPLEYFDRIPYDEDYYHWVLQRFLQKLIVIKVSKGDHQEFVIAALYDFDRLALARHSDQSWTSVFIRKYSVLIDLVSVDNYVYGLYDDGDIVFWNVREFLGGELVKAMEFSPHKLEIFEFFAEVTMRPSRYLIQSGSDFLMVIRDRQVVANSDYDDYNYDIVYQTNNFKVYKLNPKAKKWEEIKDVGSVALFVGRNYSMSVSVTVSECLRSNCIYFTDDEYNLWDIETDFGGHDMGVYDINSGERCRFYVGDDTRSSFCPPIWFIPDFRV